MQTADRCLATCWNCGAPRPWFHRYLRPGAPASCGCPPPLAERVVAARRALDDLERAVGLAYCAAAAAGAARSITDQIAPEH